MKVFFPILFTAVGCLFFFLAGGRAEAAILGAEYGSVFRSIIFVGMGSVLITFAIRRWREI